MSLLRRCKPWLFQGLKETNTYFEGWYFKFSDQNNRSYAFIPGISLSDNDSHAFIQFIDGSSANTAYVRFKLEEFSSSDQPFMIKIGENVFSQNAVYLDIASPDFSCKASLETSNWTVYPSAFLKPGIMGPFGLVGFLECYHGIVSANHKVSGTLNINGKTQTITQGKAYIEKDWGHSFPKNYIWTQANCFEEANTSVFASIATIPFKKLEFPGFIAFVHLPNKGYVTFATWNASKITQLTSEAGGFSVTFKRGSYMLAIKVRESLSGSLAAPRMGSMDRVIKESVDAVLEFALYKRTHLLAKGSSPAAGLEMSGDVQSLV